MLMGFQKTSLVNYPRKVAAVIFLPGCNMRCGFCHNAELACASPIQGAEENENGNVYFSEEYIFSYLEKRKQVLSGVVISGGEPFVSPFLYEFIKRIKELRLAVKIDTNGLLPKKLEELLYNKEVSPDMIAMDIKTSPARYSELLGGESRTNAGEQLVKSLEVLKKFKKEKPCFEVEYRTVLVPGLVGEDEIKIIGSILPPDAAWKFADFVPGNCLDKNWNAIKPYTHSELKKLTEKAKSFVIGAELR